MRLRKTIIMLFGLIALVGISLVGYRAIKVKKMQIWFGDYLSQAFAGTDEETASDSPRHLLVMFGDHFEPSGNVDYVKHWITQFRKSRKNHYDADGRHPQHTFFYPAEQFDDEEIDELTAICREGYGEIELQLHHFHDTPATLGGKLQQAIDNFTRHGWMTTTSTPPETTFGFVHGNWALDNSRTYQGSDMCGVNNEITLLREYGCYADFTFPAIETTAQPAMINRFYYALDDPTKPKSYARGTVMAVGTPPSGDLLIMHGILTIDWSDWSHIFYPSIEVGMISHETLATPRRADVWVETNNHIPGQPEWVFVKLYCHGAIRADSLSVWGPELDETFTYLETRYNDGKSWVLHYLTAREMYNIAKAAEAGETGNPADYRDYLIAPYRATLPLSIEPSADSTMTE